MISSSSSRSSSRVRSVLPCIALTALCVLATANGCGDDGEASSVTFVADASLDATVTTPASDASPGPSMPDGSTAPDADVPDSALLPDAAPLPDGAPMGDADTPDATGGDSGVCDVLAQTGCDASQKCAIAAERTDAGGIVGHSIQCVANTSPLAEGATCPYGEEIDECGPGMACTRAANSINNFICTKFCDVDAPDCAVGERCLTRERGGDLPPQVPSNVGVCTEPCSVFTTSECTCTALFQNGDGVCFGGIGVPTEGELCDTIGTPCGLHLGCYALEPGDASAALEFRCFSYCNLSHLCTGDGGTQVCTPIQDGSALGICTSP